MAGHQLEGHDGHERVDVEPLADRGLPLGRIDQAAGRDERLQIGSGNAVLPLVALDEFVEIDPRAAVVEIAAGVVEVALEKVTVDRLLEDIEPEIAVVEENAGVGHARGGDAGLEKQMRAEPFGQERRILGGIVEVELVEAVKAGAGAEAVDVDGKSRLLVEPLEAPCRALELDGNILEDGVGIDRERAGDVAPRIVTEPIGGPLGEPDLDPGDVIACKKRIGVGAARHGCRGGQCEPCHGGGKEVSEQGDGSVHGGSPRRRGGWGRWQRSGESTPGRIVAGCRRRMGKERRA